MRYLTEIESVLAVSQNQHTFDVFLSKFGFIISSYDEESNCAVTYYDRTICFAN